MSNGNWPHGPNYYQARRAKHWAGPPRRPPPIGVARAQLGLAPGTPVQFWGPEAMGYAQIALAELQQRPPLALSEAGACPCVGAGSHGRAVSPAEWAGPEAGQAGTEFAYATEPREGTYVAPVSAMGRGGPAFGPVTEPAPGPEQYTGAPVTSRWIGYPPEAVPYLERGEDPPAVCSGLIQFSSEQARESYANWWRVYYGDPPPCEAGPSPAEPIPTIGYGGPPEATITTIAEPLPPDAAQAPRPFPWGWVVGGTAAAGAVVAGIVYAATRKRRRRG
jgi:hypothetical protein